MADNKYNSKNKKQGRNHSPNTACTRDEDINVDEFLRVI